MQLNMITSEIKLIGTVIKSMNIDNSIVDVQPNAQRSFGFNINEPTFEECNDRMIAELLIDFAVEIEQNENEKCRIEFTVGGAFASENHIDKTQFERLVMINGAAAIMGIARGKIEAVSANIFNCGKVSIPFVNIVDYYKSLKQ